MNMFSIINDDGDDDNHYHQKDANVDDDNNNDNDDNDNDGEDENDDDDEMTITWLMQENSISSSLSYALIPITITVIKLRDIIVDKQQNYHSVDQEFLFTVKFFEQNILKNNSNENNFYEAKISHRYYDEFIVKMNIDFYLNSTEQQQSFLLDLIEKFRSVMAANVDNNCRIVLEFPYNSLRYLKDECSFNIDDDMDFITEMRLFSIGSIVNLCYFVHRFRIFKPISSENFQLEMEWNFQKYLIIFYFCFPNGQTYDRYKIEISFASIQFILIEIDGSFVCLELNSAPFLFLERKSLSSSNIVRTKWIRCKEFGQKNDPDLIGYGHGYRLQISDDNLKKFLYATIRLSYLCKERNRKFSFYIGRIDSIDNKKNYPMSILLKNIDEIFAENFRRNYACRVILKSYRIVDRFICRHGIFDFKNIENFLADLTKLSNDQQFEDYLYELDVKSNNPVIDFIAEFDRIINTDDENRPERISGKNSLFNDSNDERNYVIMRRAIMTPTCLLFFRPTACLRSRFSNIANLDYAIRLTLCEDNSRVLNGTYTNTEFVKECIMPRLLSGIQLADRHYEFLGSSSSQMRDCGIIFYACDNQNRTAEYLRNIVGNLSIFKRKVAKYIARFGLIFSQAIAYYHCDESVSIYRSGDLTNGSFIFSDGGGIISNSLARKILPLLDTPENYFPSAFQIRYGGCKGMLVRYDSDDSGDMIMFRESMIKYHADDDALGILKFSAPRPVYLNRPLIQILCEQKVPAKVFYTIITESTESLSKSLMFETNAYELMQTYHQRHLSYSKLYKAGFSFLNEPFLRRILNHLLFYRLNELKLKARIKIPTSNGRIAFGVIDETNQLESGEIFFQYCQLDQDGQPTDQKIILEDEEVMVTKFPCLSLGDVRKFRARNIVGLEHIVDCVVFPAKGQRPHPDEMGGSDIDGDEYAIFWQTNLIFPGENYPPMNFPSHNSPESDQDIIIDDIVRFYCNFLIENNIGTIATSHLMISDFHPLGLASTECKDLASKYSISLDFQKNGINAKMESKHLPDSNWIRPDFMIKRTIEFDSYLSTKFLGQIYRHCTLMEDVIRSSNIYLLANQENRLEKPNPDLVLNCWRIFEQEATKAFDNYCHLVIDHMEMLDIESEAALICNIYENRTDVGTKVLNDLFRNFQQIFEQQAQGKSSDERLLLISAWYAICFQRSDHIRYRYHDEPLFGMPFLIPNEMINLIKHVKKSNNFVQPDGETIVVVIESKHIEMATLIILFWMIQLNGLFTNGCKDLRKILKLFNHQSNEWYRINEYRFTKKIIRKRLMQIVTDEYEGIVSVKSDDRIEHQIINILFDKYLLYLYGLYNRLENLIADSDLDNVFLLKYSIFAVNFLEKLNRIDNPPIDSLTKREKMFSYKLFLRLLIRNFQLESQNCETIKFAVLNVDKQQSQQQQQREGIDCDRINFDQKDFLLKLRYLSGKITEIYVLNPNGYCLHSLIQSGKRLISSSTNRELFNQKKFIENNLTRLNVDYYQIKVTGLQTSISLLKCMIGHPKFYSNIINGYHFV
ncbi:uncharacterized protein LOC113797127 isoform X1 [Dermatophagoides pteronyssinus]|uniref:uncharacterized protein LOC113797127 isoform X1 n=1 Tax=Dermatophagoides pteronyssinus TaxID=6956 RepID=UPI003F675710